jgi:hypothetical protein
MFDKIRLKKGTTITDMCVRSRPTNNSNVLVFLAYILLQILRYRLLTYRITKTVPSMEFVVTWVRKKTRQGFIH